MTNRQWFTRRAQSYLNNDLTITGDWDFSGDLDFNGSIILNDTAEFNGQVDFDADVDFNSTTGFTGTATFDGDIALTRTNSWIGMDTSSSSDTKAIYITAAGTKAYPYTSRGAQLFLGGANSGADDAILSAPGDIKFYVNSSERWRINSSGHLVPLSDLSYNIGISTTNEVANMYVANVKSSGDLTLQTVSASGNLKLGVNSGVQWQINVSDGALRPSTTNSWDIGTSSYVVGTVYSKYFNSPSSDMSLLTGSTRNILMGPGGSTEWIFLSGGLLRPASNNSNDIGHGSYRVATVYCTTLNESSDRRLKENFSDIENSLDLLMQLQPLSYERDGNREFGFIAQDVYKIMPEVVSVGDDGKNPKAVGFKSWGIRYSGIIPHLVAAIQEQQKQIESLRRLIQ